MLEKLHTSEFDVLKAYRQFAEFPLILSVCRQQQQGVALVDKQDNTAFVLHKSGFGGLSVSDDTSYEELFARLIAETAIPQYFHVYDAPQALVQYVTGNEAIGYKLRERKQLRYVMEDVQVPELPERYSYHIIDAGNFEDTAIFNLDIPSKFWDSADHFLANGYGCFVAHEGKPVSICYSACVAGGLSEIDVMTLPTYQQKGLAKAVTAKYIEQSIEKDIVPNWDCFTDNTGSLRTAMNLGFAEIKAYDFLSVFLKNK